MSMSEIFQVKNAGKNTVKKINRCTQCGIEKFFKPRLKAVVDRVILSTDGRRFQAKGAATKNALWPLTELEARFWDDKVTVRSVAKRRPIRNVGDRSQKVDQVDRCIPVYRFVRQKAQFVIEALSDRQPVELLQRRCNVVAWTHTP
jgi:hypothetical protein